ncbi:MAG: tetratricopeptide repeat protein [Paludibacteraceae bacterium]|nr:tetratricopeptide repeat protein [Paludibacteraceae bacterium]
MRKIQLCILLLLCSVTGFAQSANSADALFQAGDYTAAQEQYAQLIKRYPNHALYNYRYARCAQELGDLPTALHYFHLSGDRYDLKHFNVGEIHLQLWHPNEAIAAYQSYLSRPNVSEEKQAYVANQIRHAEKLQRYLRRVECLSIIDSIEVAVDSLLYACPLSHEAGTLAYDSIGNIIYTNQRSDQQLWTDSAHQIVYRHRLLDQWTAPQTLPQEVNFCQQQANPYILSDGVTLYFAACDSNGLGGLDIYVTRYNTASESYTTPENLGMPYNSPANEYFLLIDEAQGIGYLATDRFAANGKAHIYSFIPTQQKQYWRNLTTDSLVAYAQLKQFVRVQPAANDSSITDDTIPQPIHNEIFFVLNDSVIYTHLNQFKSSDARKKYAEWEQQQCLIDSEQQQLEQLRLQYNSADEATQQKLAPAILRLENNQSQLSKRLNNLLFEIRTAEIKER